MISARMENLSFTTEVTEENLESTKSQTTNPK
jgi:hypothetical protein